MTGVVSEAGEPLEIERKFLIRRPGEDWLLKNASARLEMRQDYLLSGDSHVSRRIRRTLCAGRTVYHYNEKQRLSDRSRIEREEEIGEEEYRRLLEEADPARRPIEKVRWCVPYAGHTLEIDVFPFWARQAYCEAELEREDEALELPPALQVLREVSGDKRYNNNSLALEIPGEDEEA